MKKYLFILALILFSLAKFSFAAVITVGPAKDHATIGAALDACSAGDTISIYDDTYQEVYTILSSTKDWDGVTIEAAAGEDAVIWSHENATYAAYGGVRWSVEAGSVYKTAGAAFSGNYMSAIFYEHPGTGAVWRLKREASLGAVDDDDEFYHNAGTGVVYVQLQDRTLGVDPDSYIMHMNNGPTAQNALLRVHIDSARNIEDLTIKGIIFQFAQLGASSSTMKGLLYFSDSSGTYGVISPTIQDCTFRHIGSFAMNLQGTPGESTTGGPDHTMVKDCTFTDIGYPSGGADHAEVLNFGYGCIRAIVQDCTFTDDVDRMIAWLGPDEAGVGEPDENKSIIIQRCLFTGGHNYGAAMGGFGEGIRVAGKSGDILIRNNIIMGFSGCGIIEQPNTNGYQPSSLKIYFNTIVYNGQGLGDNKQNIRLNQIPLPGGTLEVKGNIIWGLRGGDNYRHELFIGSDTAMPDEGESWDFNLLDTEAPDAGHRPVRYRTNQIVWADWLTTAWGGTSPDGNSLEEDFTTDNNYPDFVDNQTDGTGDYHITMASPCIGAGPTGLVTVDYEGNTRDASPDIGAHEYVAIGSDLIGTFTFSGGVIQ